MCCLWLGLSSVSLWRIGSISVLVRIWKQTWVQCGGGHVAETPHSHQSSALWSAPLNYIHIHQVVWNLHRIYTEDLLLAKREWFREKGRCFQMLQRWIVWFWLWFVWVRWLNATQSVSHRMYSTHVQGYAFNRIDTPHYYCYQNAHLLKESRLSHAVPCYAIHTVAGEDLPSWPLSCFTGGPECCDEGLFSSEWEIVTQFLSTLSCFPAGQGLISHMPLQQRWQCDTCHVWPGNNEAIIIWSEQ